MENRSVMLYGIGNALVDMEYSVEDSFLTDNSIEKGIMTLLDLEQQNQMIEKLSANYQLQKQAGGGSAANSLVVFSQLGGSCEYSCRLADDATGKFYHSDLMEQGVTCHPGKAVGSTGKCMIMVTPDAQRTMLTHLGVSVDLSEEDIHWDSLKKSQWLFLEGYLLASDAAYAAVLKALELAKKTQLKVAFTFSDGFVAKFFKHRLDEVLGFGIDLLFCNEHELMIWSDKDALPEAMQCGLQFAQKVVATQNKDGVMIASQEDPKPIHVPANHIADVQDSNGAGDAFAGAFLYGEINGWESQLSAELAHAVAGAMVRQFGARLPQEKVDELNRS